LPTPRAVIFAMPLLQGTVLFALVGGLIISTIYFGGVDTPYKLKSADANVSVAVEEFQLKAESFQRGVAVVTGAL
jgi:hypothetical protein